MTKAIDQLMRDVAWDDTEVLVFDLPPGTGDVQLSLTQLIDVSGGVLVTTPQELALLDVGRAAGMLKQVQVPILGIIEK